MDAGDSDIIVLEEIRDRRKASSSAVINLKEDSHSAFNNLGSSHDNGGNSQDGIVHSSNGGDEDDEIDEVPDFDDADLQVLDCWEDDVEDELQEGEVKNLEGREAVMAPSIHLPSENMPSSHYSKCSDRHEKRSHSFESDKTILLEDLTLSNDSKTVENPEFLNNVNASPGKSLENFERSNKQRENKRDLKSSEKQSFGGGLIIFGDENSKRDESTSSLTSLDVKSQPSSEIDLPTDPTERKVDMFLKEMALQHPRMFNLPDKLDKNESTMLANLPSKNSSRDSLLPSAIDVSDLPPGVDLEQVAKDSTTSGLLSSALKGNGALKELCSLPFIPDSSLQATQNHAAHSYESYSTSSLNQYRSRGQLRSDTSKGASDGKERKLSSPRCKQQHESRCTRSSRSPPPHKLRKISTSRSSRSISLSPSPPRSRLFSRSPLRTSHSAAHVHNSQKYSRPPPYRSPSQERIRYCRSPVGETLALRELSRSLSRERLQLHSASRNRSFVRRRSRSRERYLSIDDRMRRYRRSSSRSWSPGRGRSRSKSRSRSRSRSPPHHRYRRRKTPQRDEARSKRHGASRSPSRSRSPWIPRPQTSPTEWQSNSWLVNGVSHSHEEMKLEHDMARFIATNIAATGVLPPPIIGIRSWAEPNLKSLEVSPAKNLQIMPEAPVGLLDQEMPLPPPPPDISELLTPDDVKETGSQNEMNPCDQNVSLSSLLESAVSGTYSRAIIDRCQDAIMKLHDDSIKTGRFAVMSSIAVPQSDPPASFQPWQSALNRSMANKIHFSFTKIPENPVHWEPPKAKSSLVKKVSPPPKSESLPTLQLSSSVPTSSTDMDRSALLEKISLLTQELHDVRQILDSKSVCKRSIGLQTTYNSYCLSCRKGYKASLKQKGSDSSVSQSDLSAKTASVLQSASASNVNYCSNSLASTSRQPLLEEIGDSSVLPCFPTSSNLPMYSHSSAQPSSLVVNSSSHSANPVVPNHSVSKLSFAHEVSSDASQFPINKNAPLSKKIPPLMLNLKKTSSVKKTPSGMEVESPMQAPAAAGMQMVTGMQTPAGVQGAAPNQTPAGVQAEALKQTPAGMQGAALKQTPAGVQGAALKQTPAGMQGAALKQTPAGMQGTVLKQTPGAKIPTSTNQTAQCKIVLPRPTPSDFDVSKYQMLGDEHLCDLISYLCSVGMKIKFDPNQCSPSNSFEKLERQAFRIKLSSQVIVMVGLYDSTYSHQVRCKYRQMVGYLRKRCNHLVLIAPPPTPSEKSWKAFKEFLEEFPPPKSDNVSVVSCRNSFLQSDGLPDISLFANPRRLNQTGLKIVADELLKVIANAKKKKFGC